MTTATLRAVGGSIVMSIPKRVLELLGLHAGSQVDVNVQNGQLVIVPKVKPRYALSELMAQCDFSQPMSQEEREWLDAPPVGLEDI
jgi:looped-hinge helix DNA binding domain, AbrB family